MNPFFSIITVAYNAEHCIAATVQSVLMQTYADFELIIQDGLSSDGTLSRIPEDFRIKICSEKDHGIYDAMNRSVLKASGKYCIFINCGDLFASNQVLQEIYNAICKEEQPIIAYGDFCMNEILYEQPHIVNDFYLYRTPLNHQSMVFSTQLFKNIGAYDCTYKILADYDLTHRCFHAGVPFVHVPIVICEYLGGGVSESAEGIKTKETERKIILKKYYNLQNRFKYDFLLLLTLRKLRMWLFSGHAPKWFTNLYRKFVNGINRDR